MTLLVAESGVMADEEDHLIAESAKHSVLNDSVFIGRQFCCIEGVLILLVFQFFQSSVEEGRYF
jgi:hypothetical protein